MTQPIGQASRHPSTYFGGQHQGLHWPQVLLLLGVFALLHIFVIKSAPWSLADHQFMGIDTYSRMVRVQDLLASGNWFDSTYHRVNPPYGLVSHWSRPMDALILAGALLLSLFMEQSSALFWAGAMISPVLQLVTLGVIVFGTRALFGMTWAVLCGLIFLLQPSVFQTFLAGRPDYHSLQIFTAAITVVMALQLISRPFNRSLCYATGAMLAIDLWVGVENVLTVVGVHAGLALAWIFWRRDYAKKGLHLSWAAVIAIVIAFILERGPQALATMPLEFDRLSALQVVYFLTAATFWTWLRTCEQRITQNPQIAVRIGLSTLGALSGAAVIYALEPGLFVGKLMTVDPVYAAARGGHIAEYVPVLGLNSLETQGLWLVVQRVASEFGLAIAGTAFLVYLLFNPRTKNREAWLLIASVLGALLAFAALRHAIVFRDAATMALVLLFPYTELVVRVVNRLSAMTWPGASLLRAGAIAFLLMWPLGMLVPVGSTNADANTPATRDVTITKACPVTKVAKYLGSAAPWENPPRRIMAISDFGPELLYRTRHSVFSIPNHRLQTGFTDTMRVMTAPDDGLARSVVERRAVDLLLICRAPFLQTFYRRAARALSFEGSMFRDRLLGGSIPTWLTPVALPDHLGDSFLLLAVKHEVDP